MAPGPDDATGTARDATDADRVIKELAETRSYLDNILQSSIQFSIIGKDLDHRILSWNEGARRNYGYEANEVLGRSSNILHTSENLASGAVDAFMKAALDDGSAEREFERVRKDGTRFWASVVLSRRDDAAGKPIGYLVMSSDISERKQAVERAESISRYARSLIEANLDPLVTISLEGKVADVNEATIKVTGADRQDIIGTDFSDYFTDPEKARGGYQQVFAKGSITDYPLTIRHKTGRLADVMYNASVFRDARGNALGVFAAREVTESQKAEQQFRSFIESAPDAMVLASNDGIILLVNNQTERLFGYQRAELLGQAVEILVPERYRGAHPGHRSKFFRDPMLRPMGAGLELWGVRKDGSEFPIELSLSPIESPQGLTVGATIRDVTTQKTASQYARSLIEASLDPLVTISPQGKITDVNEATIKVTGVPRDKLVGTDFSDYFTEPERAREGYREVFAMGSVTDYPLTIRHRNQGTTGVLYNASVYRDIHGNVSGVVAVARDMTARRRAEIEIADQRSKELDRLAELERFQKLTVGRELKMIELKKEIAELKSRAAKIEVE